ncbi:MAG: hypothetical protein KGJ80_07845 [Chloroflexota bacterium]|nr:hypothetical protein [Chloroflexota bacterium]
MPNRSVWFCGGLFVVLVVGIITACVLIDQFIIPRGIAVSGRTRGNPDAKISLVEFGDFQ